jgi:hypothetical protein
MHPQQPLSGERRERIGERRIPAERGERLGILVSGTQKRLGKRYGTRRVAACRTRKLLVA